MKKVLAVSITVAVLIIVVFILNRELPQVTATVPGQPQPPPSHCR